MRWLLILVATALLSQTTLNLVRPVTTYKLISLDAGPVTVGLATAAYALLPMVTAVWLGRFSSRIPKIRFLMLAGAGLMGLGSLGIATAQGYIMVAVASAILGMGHLMFTIGGQSSIARYFPDDQLDKGFGWFTAAYSAGQFLGPLIAGIILGTSTVADSPERIADINLSLWIGGACALLAIPLLLPNLQPRIKKVAASSSPKPQASMVSILRVKGMPSHMLASLTLLSILDILTAFLPLVAEKHGVTPAAVGVLLAIRGSASVVSRLFLPWISRHFSRKSMLLTSLYTAGITIAIAPLFIDTLWLAGLALLIGGFFLGMGQPVTMTMVSTSVPSQDRGAALAVRLMGNRLGQVLLPVAASTVAVGAGPAGAIWFCCGLLCLSGIEKSLRN
ncbi:MFS transporter [Arthrobacter sp. MYb211]|nr:MFS transporter [Arthrobacter sp. MYb224]PRA03320.1 MFS transporter [Arthrobacter sp. MYb229]PRA12037.1 MFS transporter [Arthrobacter sp. MYb221]PRB49790.1 MFS transporter [Arthrobacter sp. MYb216]PRC08390.1 MFS transporter [Arthrobacter sp. MYb211]